jgi:hypothetical protein
MRLRKSTFGHDVLIYLVSRRQPCGSVWAGQTAFLCKSKAAIKCDPKHDLRVNEVLLIIPNLPDGHIRIWVGISITKYPRENARTFPDRKNVICIDN